MRLKLIGCEVLLRELCDACAHSPHQVDPAFLTKGLKDLGGRRMMEKVQDAVDCTPEGVYDAILLGYGLCGNGLDGLAARHTRLVLPRAHDCISLLMGSHDRLDASIAARFCRAPASRWIGRKCRDGSQSEPGNAGTDESRETLIQKYGEDNGRYLYEEMTRYRSQYRKLVFIETGLEAGGTFVDEARAEAAEQGWTFEKLPGDLAWLRRLVSGEWPAEEFAIAEPGQRFSASYDAAVVQVR